MSVSGKRKDEWVAVTLTDYGQEGRRETLRHHYSMEAAFRAWPNFQDFATKTSRKGERVWQEDREGNILNNFVL